MAGEIRVVGSGHATSTVDEVLQTEREMRLYEVHFGPTLDLNSDLCLAEFETVATPPPPKPRSLQDGWPWLELSHLSNPPEW